MTSTERLKQQKTQLRKTLEFMEGISDLTNELIEEKDLVDEQSNSSSASTLSASIPSKEESGKELSVRERAMLRRKNRSNGGAAIAATPSSQAISRKAQAKLELPDGLEDLASRDLGLRIVLALRANILNSSWTVRHGSLLAIKGILGGNSGNSYNYPSPIYATLVRDVVAVLCLDRFNDFVGDQTIAPIRETAAQLVTILFTRLRQSIVKQQIWALALQLAQNPDHWQVCHGGLLCLKYLSSVDPTIFNHSFHTLYDLAIHGCEDEDEDVKCLWAELLYRLIDVNPEGIDKKVVSTLVMDMLTDTESPLIVFALDLMDKIEAKDDKALFLLAQRMRHPMSVVRIKALEIIDKMDLRDLAPQHVILLLRMMVQNIVLDGLEMVWIKSEKIALKSIECLKSGQDLLAAYVAMCSIILTPSSKPFEKRHFLFIETFDPLCTTTMPAAHEIGFKFSDSMLRSNYDLVGSRRIASRIVAKISPLYDSEVQNRIAKALCAVDDSMSKYFSIWLFGSKYRPFKLELDSEFIWDLRICLADSMMGGTSNFGPNLLKKYVEMETIFPLRQDLADHIKNRFHIDMLPSLLSSLYSKKSRSIALPTLSLAFTDLSIKPGTFDSLIPKIAWLLIEANQENSRIDIDALQALDESIGLDESEWETELTQDLVIALARRSPTHIAQKFLETLIPMSRKADTLYKRRVVELIKVIFAASVESIYPFTSLFVIPVLGKIADSDEVIRQMASALFGDLVRLLPLHSQIKADSLPSSLETFIKEAEHFLSLFMGSNVSSVEDIGSQKRALAMPHHQIPITIHAKLRAYQQAGVNWLAFLCKYGLNGALCDDMGLGKTLQTIVVLASHHHNTRSDGLRFPSLIVCPASLVGHWRHEIKTYAPSLGEPLIYAGSPGERRSSWPLHKSTAITITSYETVRSDIALIGVVKWDFVVLDEGHVIKNPKTKLTQAIKSLQAEHRLILSGTPIQNNVVELWSLFDFLMPGMLGTEAEFMDRYGKAIMAVQPNVHGGNCPNGGGMKEFEEAEKKLNALHRQVLPFILRRMKEDVLKDLPPKIIQDYECDPSPVQRLLCEEIGKQLDGNDKYILDDNPKRMSICVLQVLQYLRKVCVHPNMVLTEDHPLIDEVKKTLASMGIESLDDLAVAPKLSLLKELLLECGIGSETDATTGEVRHRVLLFAQQKGTLDLIERLILHPHLPNCQYLRLDGNIDQNDRFGIAQRFNSDPTFEILLLTTSVGGLGLNLTGADTVIFVEHDWNPMKDLQAMDRAHRLGQKRVVTVYRLIVRDTLEQQIMGLQRWKRRVAATIVQQQDLQGEGYEKAAPNNLLDLLATSDEPAGKKAKRSVEDRRINNWLATHGTMLEMDGIDGQIEGALVEYSEAFDLNSFLKSVNQTQ